MSEIQRDNAAFSYNASGIYRRGGELRRILTDLAERLQDALVVGDEAVLRDINGNTAGKWNSKRTRSVCI